MKNVKTLVNILNKHRIKLGIFLMLCLFTLLPMFKTSNNKKINLLTMVSNKITGAGTYTEVIKSIEIESTDYKDKAPGSWHIDKSAKWTGINKAKVTFDVKSIMKASENNKDIILVLDISGSMKGDKIAKVKSDSIELVESLLSDPNNKVALVVYDTDSEIISEFTNDKDTLVNKINSLSDKGDTNYNAPLKHVDQIMTNYTKEDNRDVITLLLTDGYPNVDTPNQIGTYELLKSKYPYMEINGIQYEMGSEIKNELKQVTDKQWIADMDTLNNVLFEASVSPFIYDKFEVVDYIDKDYFALNSVDDITVSTGTVKLTEENGLQKITWTLDSYMTGSKATMNIDLQLKEQYAKSEGYYSTNDSEQVTYKLDNDTKIIQSEKTPVLEKKKYNVIYEANTPTGCNIENTSETHFVYENVTLNSDQLSCDGYLFKGWKLITEAEKVNGDTFVMPSSDVIVRATWTKQTLAKSMDGTIKVNSQKLYLTVQKDAEEGVYASTYTGNVTDEYDKTEETDIYYYKGENPNNNVIFGDFCWQIVRTTATGGVKMIYNGVPSDGKCNNTGANSQIGTSAFNSFNSSYYSPSFVGYMYNKIYTRNTGAVTYRGLYGKDVIYDGTNYTLVDTTTTDDGSHHYSCNNTTGTCSTVRYYYVKYYAKRMYYYYYIVLDGAQNVYEALNEMFSADDVNKTDSTIKTYIDNWYQSNMMPYTDYLEDTVFCNDRRVTLSGGWNPGYSLTSSSLDFASSTQDTANLKCTNETDRFSMSNSKAKLTYPVGLLSVDETLLGKTTSTYETVNYYLNTGSDYWTGSPYIFSSEDTFARYVDSNGRATHGIVYNAQGVRPVVSLKTDVAYSEGDGSKDSPYIIEIN